METFKASVQYGDLKGSVAADRGDNNDPYTWLKNNDLIGDDELVVGIRMRAGENHGVHKDPVSVRFLVAELNDHENLPQKIQAVGNPLQVREIRVDMDIAEFLGIFKRFEVTLSSSSLFEGETYVTD